MEAEPKNKIIFYVLLGAGVAGIGVGAFLHKKGAEDTGVVFITAGAILAFLGGVGLAVGSDTGCRGFI